MNMKSRDVCTERMHIWVANGQIINDNWILTHSLCGNRLGTVGTWSMSAFLCFVHTFSSGLARGGQVCPSNPSHQEASPNQLFPASLCHNLQSELPWTSSPFFAIKLSCSPACLGVSASASDNGRLPCYSKLWTGSPGLLSSGWSVFIPTMQSLHSAQLSALCSYPLVMTIAYDVEPQQLVQCLAHSRC